MRFLRSPLVQRRRKDCANGGASVPACVHVASTEACPTDGSVTSAARYLAWALQAGFLLLAVWVSQAAADDEVEMLSGMRIRGTFLQETADGIIFQTSGTEMKLDLQKVHAITVGGERRVIHEKPSVLRPVANTPLASPVKPPAATQSAPTAPATAPASTPASTPAAPAPSAKTPSTGNTKTSAEIEALINKEGSSLPAWWNSVKLTYPPTLDLTWVKAPGAWDTNKNLGQYLWSVINENSSKWQEGIRLLHHVMDVNKNDQAKFKQSMNALATAYAELLGDWARAAFWWRKGGGGGHGYGNEVALARSYFILGNRDMSIDQLSKDTSGNDDAARLWGDLGDNAKAMQLAERFTQSQPAPGNLLCGDICRQAGRFQDALTYYQKVLAFPQARQAVVRAQNSIDALKGLELLDLKRIPDGTYKADYYGYSGQVFVEVTVKAAKIEDVVVAKHTEKQYYGSIRETPPQILAKQGIKGVDAYSSATITSEAIINAAAKALVSGMK